MVMLFCLFWKQEINSFGDWLRRQTKPGEAGKVGSEEGESYVFFVFAKQRMV